MNERNTAVRAMIQQLQDAFNETLNVLYDLPEDYLQQPCEHACARGGSARDLLVHNIFHEKQHTGQVWNIRDELRQLAIVQPQMIGVARKRMRGRVAAVGTSAGSAGPRIPGSVPGSAS